MVLASIALIAMAQAVEPVVVHDTLPSTLNPLYGQDLADMRAQQLVFTRLFYSSAVS
jgi:hypothetical protein